MSEGMRAGDYGKREREEREKAKRKEKDSSSLGAALAQPASRSGPGGRGGPLVSVSLSAHFPPFLPSASPLLLFCTRPVGTYVTLHPAPRRHFGGPWGGREPLPQVISVRAVAIRGELPRSARRNRGRLGRRHGTARSARPVADRLRLLTCGHRGAGFVARQNLPHHNVYDVNSFSLSHAHKSSEHLLFSLDLNLDRTAPFVAYDQRAYVDL